MTSPFPQFKDSTALKLSNEPAGLSSGSAGSSIAGSGGRRTRIAFTQDRLVDRDGAGLDMYPKGDVYGPCVCGSWPGGECLYCPVQTAENESQKHDNALNLHENAVDFNRILEPEMTEIPADLLKAAHKKLMSELFVACQPNRGDVFSFMDDRPELLAAALTVAVKTERERIANLASEQAKVEDAFDAEDALNVLASRIRREA